MNNINKMRKQFIRDAGYEPSQQELIEYIKNNMAHSIDLPNKSNGDKLVGALVLIWFFTSIGSLLYLSATEKTIEMMVVFGHYFLMFGIMILMSNFKKIDLDTAYKILFSVGIVFVLYIDFFSNGIKFNMNMNEDMFVFFILGLIFFVAGIGMLIAVIKNKIKPNGVDVQAVVCEHKYDGKSSICIYEYEYDGKTYKNSDEYYTTKKKPPIGSIHTIKVNPAFPSNVVSTGIDYNLLFISIPFILMGGLMIFVSLFVK